MDDLIGGEIETANESTNDTAQATEREDQPYVGLALRWRPRTFEEVVGQRSVAESLRSAIARGRISQAYLFCGPRGVGKTSSARILARAINCVKGPTPEPCGVCTFCRSIAAGNDMDVVEIDGASNNKVDDIRDLREQVNFTPFAARYKVYIIDEVHMLSTGAFNALLKTLEEPPERVKFIFATTEPHKVPATIRSRCQIVVFGHISEADMIDRLERIIASEPKIAAEPDERRAILQTIAHHAEGSMRDAVVALDQVLALGEGRLTMQDVQDLLGLVDSDACLDIFENIISRQTADLLRVVDRLVAGGRDLERVVRQLVQLVRDALILKAGGPPELIKRNDSERQRIASIIARVSLAQMVNVSQVLIGLEEQMRSGLPVRFALELALVKLTGLAEASDVSELLKKLEGLSRQIEGGGSSAGGASGGSGATVVETPSRPASGTPRAASRPAATRAAAPATPIPMAVLEATARPLDAPAIVGSAVMFPEDLPSVAAVDTATSPAELRVSEALAEFETEPGDETPAVVVIEPGADRHAPRVAAPGDPRAWLRETLERNPSLQETVDAIKEIFAAREVALDGIPLS